MNKNLKEALLQKYGYSDLSLGCMCVCNDWEFKIGNKYVTIWKNTFSGRKHLLLKVEITKDIASELAEDLHEYGAFDVMRTHNVVATVVYHSSMVIY